VCHWGRHCSSGHGWHSLLSVLKYWCQSKGWRHFLVTDVTCKSIDFTSLSSVSSKSDNKCRR
jgi:hypothetical protein